MGTVSNRSAIGAKIRIKAAIGGVARWQVREISGGRGSSQDDLRALFGLGDATVVETVRIEWPSGTIQELRNVPAGQFLVVIEPPCLDVLPVANRQFRLQIIGGLGIKYLIESSTNLVQWQSMTVLTNQNRSQLWTDSEPMHAQRQFYRVVEPEE